MARLRILLFYSGLALAAVIAALVLWLSLAPPELLRVGDGYAAKIVCSSHFLGQRPVDKVLADDVQAPGHPILKLVQVRIDGSVVSASILGAFAKRSAVYSPGTGCNLANKIPTGPHNFAKFPTSSTVVASVPVMPDSGLSRVLTDASLAGPGMRAIVVMKDGQVVGEAYGPEFGPSSRLLGWSMTKTVNAALVGRVMKSGKLNLDDHGLFPHWQDGRKAIRVRDLLSMKSGLSFNEDYGDVSDVSRMLFLEADMANYAANQPLATAPGSKFNYSSGTAVLLARLWQDRVGQDSQQFPIEALFKPLGMTSAVMETDASGTFVGSSYMYATARDWGLFGQFLLEDGAWHGERLLPEGYVALMRTSNGSADGYSLNQTWLPGAQSGPPPGTFRMDGHDGQSVTIVPSEKLVVVRLGLTPAKLGYSPDALVVATMQATSKVAPRRNPQPKP